MDDFYLIGLTGNLGSGKSTVRRMLEQMGAQGMDADKLAHVAMQRGTSAWATIVAVFGTDILKFNGEIDRQKLAARVFDDPNALHKLEAIVHPAVANLIKETLRQESAPVVVVEAIKLIEAGLHTWCDALWVVTCAPEIAAERVAQERNMRPEQVRARVAAQSSVEEKTRLATVVIDNSGDEQATRAQVRDAWEKTVHPGQGRPKGDWLSSTPRSKTTPSQPAPAQPAPPPADALKPPSVPAAKEATPLAERAAPAEPSVPPSPKSEEAAPEESVPPPSPKVEAPSSAGKEAGTAPKAAAAPPSKGGDIGRPPAPSATVEVRRARRSDLYALALALAKREGQGSPLPREQVVERFSARGYRISILGDRVVALASWEAENLVATLREVWAESAEVAPRALGPLLALIEQEAQALSCEVSIALIDTLASGFVVDQIRASGYQPSDLNSLHRMWRQGTQARLQTGDQIWVKRLREEMVTQPI